MLTKTEKQKLLDQAYGKSLRDLSKILSHDTPLLRMLPLSKITRSLVKLSTIYGKSGMTVNGILYQLAPLVPVTSGKESGSLPTPTANPSGMKAENCLTKDGQPARPGERAYSKKTGKHKTWSLEQAILTLPTPTCRDSGGPLPPRKKNPSGGQKPPLVSVMCSEKSMRLNPQFVEAMMGYPIDYTLINIERNVSNS